MLMERQKVMCHLKLYNIMEKTLDYMTKLLNISL